MKKFISRCERFFGRHRDVGIRNLMVILAVGNAVLFVFSQIDRTNLLGNLLCFDRTSILHGQVWRLLTFPFVPVSGGGVFGVLLFFLMLFAYCRIGQMLEEIIGVFKFNAFILSGVLLMDVFGLIFDLFIYGEMLFISLLIAFATLYPEIRVFLIGIIPIRFKYLAWVYLGLVVVETLQTRSIAPLVPMLNYLLFFWVDVPNLLPLSWRVRLQQGRRPKAKPSSDWAANYRPKEAPKAEKQQTYRHRCTVCGRTDAEYPDLEFRYCSKCSGYHCYCMDHINNHAHITNET